MCEGNGKESLPLSGALRVGLGCRQRPAAPASERRVTVAERGESRKAGRKGSGLGMCRRLGAVAEAGMAS